MFRVFFPDQFDEDPLGFSMWETSQKAVCRHEWLSSLGTVTWRQQHLLPAYTGFREVPLHVSQTSLPTGPQGLMAEVSPSHLLPWSHPLLSWPARSHPLASADLSSCIFLSSVLDGGVG